MFKRILQILSLILVGTAVYFIEYFGDLAFLVPLACIIIFKLWTAEEIDKLVLWLALIIILGVGIFFAIYSWYNGDAYLQ